MPRPIPQRRAAGPAGTAKVSGRRVLILRGNDGGIHRPDAGLTGALVHYCATYERHYPDLDGDALTRHWQAAGLDSLLITSGELLQRLLALVPGPQHPWLCDRLLVVPSPRVAEMAEGAGFTRIVIAQRCIQPGSGGRPGTEEDGMTEQQEVQPSAAATVADNNKPAPGTTGSKKGSSGTVFGGIAILLALGLAGGLYVHGHQNAAAQQAELVALKQQLADAMTRIDQGKQGCRTDRCPRQEPAAVAGGAGRLADQGADLDDKRPNDWMLAESEYLVRMAGRKLWLEHDIVSAITLLGNADERIKALNDPSLMPIRKGAGGRHRQASRGCRGSIARG